MSDVDPTINADELQAERDAAQHQASTLQSEKSNLEREVAFLRAGIDTTTPNGALFMRGYDGELTVDKVKEAAQGFGLGAQPEAPAEPNPTLEPGEADMTREREDLGSESLPDQGLVADPYEEARTLGQQIISEGGKTETGIGAAINYLARAAQNGDSRVIIDRRSSAGAG